MNNLMKVLLLVCSLIGVIQGILERTYYDALDIPISATPQQIRDAFKKMSKKYHPDRNPGAKDKFQVINNAYQTLSDSSKKYLYDRVGRQKMNDPNLHNQIHVQSLKGPQLRSRIHLQLKDFYLGKQLAVTVEKKIACPHCKGSGAENPNDIVTCGDCAGKGRITRRVQLGGGYYNLFTQVCPRCQGKGKVIGRKCTVCRSQKILQGLQQFPLLIKPGTPSNTQLRLQNMADQRMEGAPGDIFFQLNQINHPYLKREGDDLSTQIYITLKQAVGGWTKDIVHLDGRSVTLSETGITQPGSIRMIEGEGMPMAGGKRKGNMFVKVSVVIPHLNEDQRDQLTGVLGKMVDM